MSKKINSQMKTPAPSPIKSTAKTIDHMLKGHNLNHKK